MTILPPRFLPPQPGDIPEIDRVAGAPHPREMLSLVGHDAQERAFLALYNAGTLHHAFLLTGPEGIGKATFAYRAARFLLASGAEAGNGLFGGASTLDVPEEARATQLVAHLAHPDLGVLKRRYDSKTKKFRTEISVEDTREALDLFAKTAAFGGWRVIIVDAADDLNKASANALLKTLEEPPEKAIFFLVAHQPQKLLPTIRSRCRVLAFSPLGDADLAAVAGAVSTAKPDSLALARAGGSVRRLLRHSEPGLRAFIALIDEILANLPKRRHAEIDRIAETTRTGAEGEQALADLLEALEGWLHARIRDHAAAGDVLRASLFAEFWSRMQEEAARVEAVNLDRRAFVITLFDSLAALVSGAPR
ncbi:MAG: DNA polymerase III subunit delta' [Proteobacteria bacterium]|nr:DNA polymerase III subunit delta' [Pseudomonadota bacterium]